MFHLEQEGSRLAGALSTRATSNHSLVPDSSRPHGPAFHETQRTGLHIRPKICKYAQQNTLLSIPASIPLLQPSFHYLILSVVCKTSFKYRKDTGFSFLSISYSHNRWKKLKVVIDLYSNFHKHKLGQGSHHTAPTFKIQQYKKHTLLFTCYKTYTITSVPFILQVTPQIWEYISLSDGKGACSLAACAFWWGPFCCNYCRTSQGVVV